MLLALNSTIGVDWEELQTKVINFAFSHTPRHSFTNVLRQGTALAGHLAQPLSRYRDYLAIARPVLPASTTTSPPPRS